MEKQTTVINLNKSKLYQSLDILDERYFEKFRAAVESGAPLQITGPDLRELTELFETHNDIALKVLLLHGAYVAGIMVLVKKLDDFGIGKTGAHLVAEQLQALKDVVAALHTMNAIHTNLPQETFDLNTIHEYLGL